MYNITPRPPTSISLVTGDVLSILLVEEGLSNTQISVQMAKTSAELCMKDTDNDGIPGHLNLDSDSDGCPDAIEGTANLISSQLVTATGTLATQTPNKNLGNTVDANGIPTITGSGQAIGNAANAAINDCKFVKPAINTGTALDTNVGISTIETTAGWPQNRKGAYLALESQGKGLVISRLITTQITAIAINSQ